MAKATLDPIEQELFAIREQLWCECGGDFEALARLADRASAQHVPPTFAETVFSPDDLAIIEQWYRLQAQGCDAWGNDPCQ